jgi:hypothetical protein
VFPGIVTLEDVSIDLTAVECADEGVLGPNGYVSSGIHNISRLQRPNSTNSALGCLTCQQAAGGQSYYLACAVLEVFNGSKPLFAIA